MVLTFLYSNSNTILLEIQKFVFQCDKPDYQIRMKKLMKNNWTNWLEGNVFWNV